jgi:F-type H+-transporting ATPase subunit b
MEQTLQALGGILLKAIPTVIILLLLHWYLKAMLFRPLQKVLAERDAETAGARRKAEEMLRLADSKAAEFDRALADARAGLYREQEAQRKRLVDDQADQVRGARARVEKQVASARADIEKQAAEARVSLGASSQALADEIARNILGRGAAA